MGMPIITASQIIRSQAITDIIESVALEQTALSHILNAEGEKIQAVVKTATTTSQLTAVNASVKSMVNTISMLEMVLQSKLELFSDCLCPPTTPCTIVGSVDITKDFTSAYVDVVKTSNTLFDIGLTGAPVASYPFIISTTPSGLPINFITVPVGVTTGSNTFTIDVSKGYYGTIVFTVGTGA
ncbi:MAG: hypothetical protein RSF82_01695 [Angelakisella sp.]